MIDIKFLEKTQKWWCSDPCKTKKAKKNRKADKKPDYINSHSKALLWRGLNDLVRRDAVRENDGESMVAFWKIDLVEFSQKNHYKYSILAHRLIAGLIQDIFLCLCRFSKKAVGGVGSWSIPLTYTITLQNRYVKFNYSV